MLDEVDQKIFDARQRAFLAKSTPQQGDVVEFSDGIVRRISHAWPEDVQTSESGSWYFGDGCMSFSGSLFGSVPTSSLTLTDRTKQCSAWFFHHDWYKAHNSVRCEVTCRVWACSLPAPT